MSARAWIKRRIGVGAWVQGRLTELGSQMGAQATARFKPEVERVVRYAKLAAWFGIAGFVVGLLALIGFIALILDLL